MQLKNGQYYVGSTGDLQRRMKEHVEGKSTYTHGKQPRLVYYEEYDSREDAWRREKQIHGWTRVKKEKLISGEWKKQVYPELVEGEQVSKISARNGLR